MLDLAAGTGKLTRQLVPFGARIVAVERLDAMLGEPDGCQVLDRVASTSFVGAMETDRRREFLDEVRDAVSALDEPLDLRYLTDVYVCESLDRGI